MSVPPGGRRGALLFFLEKGRCCIMTTILHGNILHAPRFGELAAIPKGYLVAEGGAIRYVGEALPAQYRGLPVEDWGDRLILPSFADLHLHAIGGTTDFRRELYAVRFDDGFGGFGAVVRPQSRSIYLTNR